MTFKFLFWMLFWIFIFIICVPQLGKQCWLMICLMSWRSLLVSAWPHNFLERLQYQYISIFSNSYPVMVMKWAQVSLRIDDMCLRFELQWRRETACSVNPGQEATGIQAASTCQAQWLSEEKAYMAGCLRTYQVLWPLTAYSVFIPLFRWLYQRSCKTLLTTSGMLRLAALVPCVVIHMLVDVFKIRMIHSHH